MAFINDVLISDSLLLFGKKHLGTVGIYDDFSGGTKNSFWSDEFQDSYSLPQYPPGSGNYTAVRGASGDKNLTDRNYDSRIGGDFVLEFGIKFGENNTGNTSERLLINRLSNPSSNWPILGWDSGYIEWPDSSTQQVAYSFSQYDLLRLKMVRIGSSICAYYYDGSSWVQVGSCLTMSEDFYLQVNGADLHGIDYFNFTAEYGFPTTPGGSDFVSHRMENKVRDRNDLIKMWEGLSSL